MICKNALNRRFRLHSIDEGQEDEGALFQPLHEKLTGAGTSGGSRLGIDLIEEARDKGLRKGLESGREEARSLLRASFAPGLKTFLKSCDDLAQLEEKIQSRTAAGITRLALAIAERILDAPVPMDLKDLHPLIQNAVVQVHGIHLNIHPDDLRALQKTFADAGLGWPAVAERLLQVNAAVQPGEMRAAENGSSRQMLECRISEAFSELFSGSSNIPA